MERKLFKKLIVTALCAATITCAGIAGAGLVNAFSSQPITASAAEEVAERKDVKITSVDRPDGMFACVRFDLDSSRTGNGTFVAKKLTSAIISTITARYVKTKISTFI